MKLRCIIELSCELLQVRVILSSYMSVRPDKITDQNNVLVFLEVDIHLHWNMQNLLTIIIDKLKFSMCTYKTKRKEIYI